MVHNPCTFFLSQSQFVCDADCDMAEAKVNFWFEVSKFGVRTRTMPGDSDKYLRRTTTKYTEACFALRLTNP